MARHEKESLLSRWSRLKREAREFDGTDSVRNSRSANSGESVLGNSAAGNGNTVATQVPVAADDGLPQAASGSETAPLPELPSLESLGPDSDFSVFMDPRVDEDTRRAALRSLFRTPEFNFTDGLDVYAEDYTKLEKLTPALVAGLRYAQQTLFAKNDNARGTEILADSPVPAGVETELTETDAHTQDEATGDDESLKNTSADISDLDASTTGHGPTHE